MRHRRDARRLLDTSGQVARLRGADTVIVGIQPGVSLAMVQLGVTLEALERGLDLEDGIRLLHVRSGGDERDADHGG